MHIMPMLLTGEAVVVKRVFVRLDKIGGSGRRGDFPMEGKRQRSNVSARFRVPCAIHEGSYSPSFRILHRLVREMPSTSAALDLFPP
jgi:hypothetical protein